MKHTCENNGKCEVDIIKIYKIIGYTLWSIANILITLRLLDYLSVAPLFVVYKTVFDAMRKNDIAGKRVVDKYIEYLGVGVSNFINIFQPDVLCIGGGICKEGDTLIKPLKNLL